MRVGTFDQSRDADLHRILLLAFLLGFIVPNVIRYPWHGLVFVVVGVGLILAMGGVYHWIDKQ